MKSSRAGPTAEAGRAGQVRQTIVDQVDAMKRLVNEVPRLRAAAAAAELKPLDLNALSPTCCTCTRDGDIPRRCRCAPSWTRVARRSWATQQLRQVIHNLLQNAQDTPRPARCRPQEAAGVIATQWNGQAARAAAVLDSRQRLPEHILKRAFEPTSPPGAQHRPGAGVVKKIADEHRASTSNSSRTAGLRRASVAYHSLPVASSSAVALLMPSWSWQGEHKNHGKHTGRRRRAGDPGSVVGDPERRRAQRRIWPRTPRRPARPPAGPPTDLVLLDIWMPDTDGVTCSAPWSTGAPMPVIAMRQPCQHHRHRRRMQDRCAGLLEKGSR